MTPNLAIAHIAPNQNQKEVTANEAFDALDGALAGVLEVDVSGTGDVALDPDAARRTAFLKLTGSPGAAVSVVVPASPKSYKVLADFSGAFTITLRTAGDSGVAVTAGANAELYCDGGAVVRFL